jgi:hypothetical protein
MDFQSIVYLPPETNINLKINIIAGIKAYNQGYSSIDYVKKKFKNIWVKQLQSEKTDEDKEYRWFTKLAMMEIDRVCEELQKFNIPNTKGYIIARAALWRLQTSLYSALILLRQSFFYETIAVIRIIFEQISWVYSIYSLKDLKDIMEVSPTRSISKIKGIFPSAGKIYGFLSEHAHLSTKLISNYIEIFDEFADVTIKDSTKNKQTMYALFLMVDLYAIVSELIFYDLFKKIRTVYLNDDKKTLVIDGSREFEKEVLQKLKVHLP